MNLILRFDNLLCFQFQRNPGIIATSEMIPLRLGLAAFKRPILIRTAFACIVLKSNDYVGTIEYLETVQLNLQFISGKDSS